MAIQLAVVTKVVPVWKRNPDHSFVAVTLELSGAIYETGVYGSNIPPVNGGDRIRVELIEDGRKLKLHGLCATYLFFGSLDPKES